MEINQVMEVKNKQNAVTCIARYFTLPIFAKKFRTDMNVGNVKSQTRKGVLKYCIEYKFNINKTYGENIFQNLRTNDARNLSDWSNKQKVQ
jgi:hypothetical protein